MEEGTTPREMKIGDTKYIMKPLKSVTLEFALEGKNDICIIGGIIYLLEVKPEEEILITDTNVDSVMEQVDSSFSKLKATEDDITTAHIGNHSANPSAKSGRDSLVESNTDALPGAGSVVESGSADGIIHGQNITPKLLDHAFNCEPSTSSTPQGENIQASGQNLETHKTSEESLEKEEMRKAWDRVNQRKVCPKHATMDLFGLVYQDRRRTLISQIDEVPRERTTVPAYRYTEDGFLDRVYNSMTDAGIKRDKNTVLGWFKDFIKEGRTETHGVQQRNDLQALAPVQPPSVSQQAGASTSESQSSELQAELPDPNQSRPSRNGRRPSP
ncbi:hypothetical protein RvY_18371 [Ramazzottius varieornatus]|uniref:Uncharacterized protein n=1 Tax=Ramazzottius varieornatus TaxID=947166 RepID=A0A1D1W5H7_RAMVA|nr:hypothetical protein RvY_18371 [Ramazzottius varieornatus]